MTVALNGVPETVVAGAPVKVYCVAAPALTVTMALPVMELELVSVAVSVWSATEVLNRDREGARAARERGVGRQGGRQQSLLLKWTMPL